MSKKLKKLQNLKSLKILSSNILVEPILESEEVGELIKTVQYDDKAFSGRVVLIGEEVKDIEVGCIVYFNKYSSTVFPLDGIDYFVLKEEDIIGFVRILP